MPKRLHDTEVWKKPWFRRLPPHLKCLYLFVKDQCDAAGVWDVDLELASFHIGQDVDAEAAREAMGSHIEAVANGRKWWLVDFCNFQYGALKNECRPHRAVIELLRKHDLLERVLEGYQSTTSSAKDKDKDQDKDKEGDARGSDAGPWRHYANQVMQAYPAGRRGLRGSALNAIGCAIRDLMQSPPDGVEPNPDAVADWLLARTRRFAECVRGADNPQFIWTAARWFEEQGYLQDESEWRQVGRNGKPPAQTDAERQERAAKAEQQRVARQARAEEERRQRASDDREREAFIASKSDDELSALKDEVLATLPPASQRIHAGYDPRTNSLMTKLIYAHCKGNVHA